jgi:hypothetical protein
MNTPQPNDAKHTHARIKRLGDPTKPTHAQAAAKAPDGTGVHPTMVPLPKKSKPQAGQGHPKK